MRVNRGSMVFASEGFRACGVVLADADDRQGYFWMRRGVSLLYWVAGDPRRDDVCVPLSAVQSVKRYPGKTEVKLTISRAEIEELPQRWQMQPQQTVQEMVRALPLMGGMAPQLIGATGAIPMVPQLPASVPQQPAIPMPGPVERAPSFAEAQALGETVVCQFSQKAELIREIAKIQAAMESEQIPDTLKQVLAREADAAYERLKTITEQTDVQMGAYLSRNGR